MICIKQISLITSILIGPLPLLMFVCMILQNGIVDGDNDAEGRRQYIKAGKPKVVNHRIYDPNKLEE